MGTPSSKSFAKTLEKLSITRSSARGQKERETKTKRDTLFEEKLLVFGVSHGGLSERLVLDDSLSSQNMTSVAKAMSTTERETDHVGWQHHQRLGLVVLVLLGTGPLSPGPLLIEQKLVVVVARCKEDNV